MELTEEQKLIQTIAQKASEDIVFKQSLITNPKKTIENFTGKDFNLPKEKTIKVYDQSDASIIYINIPPSQVEEDVELSEEQLDFISGGGNPTAGLQTG